jgi:hypothetical protein
VLAAARPNLARGGNARGRGVRADAENLVGQSDIVWEEKGTGNGARHIRKGLAAEIDMQIFELDR